MWVAGKLEIYGIHFYEIHLSFQPRKRAHDFALISIDWGQNVSPEATE